MNTSAQVTPDPAASQATLLSVRHLQRRFGGLVAVDDVSLQLSARELMCVIGPNGAGKSTLLNLICGTLRPTAGQVIFDGHDLTRLSLHIIARIGVARKFQVPSVFERLSVRDNLEVAMRGTQAVRGSAVSIAELLDLLCLTNISQQRAGDLAHGQKQWLEIGMAMASNPKLLLLDEPTAGMTVEESLRTADLLKAARERFAMIVIEHDMRFVRALDCHTVVLHQGSLIAQGPFARIQQDPTVRNVYLGRG